MRIDKFLWAVRLCKTRSLASRLCDNEKVKINGAFCKAAKTVVVGDKISIRQNPIWKEFKVLDIPKSRVSAKLVEDLIKEVTDELDLELLREVQESNRQARMQGFRGRPTKKDRRRLDDLFD